MSRRTTAEVLALLSSDNPLNIARKIYCYHPTDDNPVEMRRLEFEAVERIAAALSGEPVVWQQRCMYDSWHPRNQEWCDWHDCSKEWFDKVNADIVAGATRVETRALTVARAA